MVEASECGLGAMAAWFLCVGVVIDANHKKCKDNRCDVNRTHAALAHRLCQLLRQRIMQQRASIRNLQCCDSPPLQQCSQNFSSHGRKSTSLVHALFG